MITFSTNVHLTKPRIRDGTYSYYTVLIVIIALAIIKYILAVWPIYLFLMLMYAR